MGETILVGVDGSAGSHDALRWALQEARSRHARVIVAHAWHMPSTAVPMGLPIYPVSRERMGSEARAVLEASVAAVPGYPDVEVTTELIEAHPVDALLTLAGQADLIVVGSRGLGAVKRALLGSVSLRLAQHAHKPVVIVPVHEEAV